MWEASLDPRDSDHLLGKFGIDSYGSKLFQHARPSARDDYKALSRKQDRIFARSMLATGQELLARGRVAEAEEEFSRALGLYEDIGTLLARASLYENHRKYDASTRDYNRVLDLDPSNSRALQYFNAIPSRNHKSLLNRALVSQDMCDEQKERESVSNSCSPESGESNKDEERSSASNSAAFSHRDSHIKSDHRKKSKKKACKKDGDDHDHHHHDEDTKGRSSSKKHHKKEKKRKRSRGE